MNEITFAGVSVAQRLPERSSKISRTTLALFAGASGDSNPIHLDIDFARGAGLPDVFAHGMLSMAYLAQLLTHWVPQERLRRWNVRFTSVTPVGATVTTSGEVIEKYVEDGEQRVKVKILARTDAGLETLVGEAVVALP